MRRSIIAASFAVAGVVASSVALLQGPALADTTLVDQTIPGPIGGAQVCVLGTNCATTQGIANVHVLVTVQGAGLLTPPALTPGSAPGCTTNVNLALFVTTPGVSGTLHTAVSFVRTDKNGNVIPGSETTITSDVPVTTPPSLTLPLASVCATIL